MPTIVLMRDVSAWEILASVLSAAAFLVAIAALYAASLKRADLRISFVPGTTFRTGGHGMTDYRFSGLSLHADLSAYNSGARGTILTGITAEIVDREAPLVAEAVAFRGSPVVPPAAFEAGDVRLINMSVGLQIVAEGANDRERLVALSEGVERLNRRITVVFRYSYVRGYSLNPWRFGRSLVAQRVLREAAVLSVYADAFKERLDMLDGLQGRG